MGSGQVLRDVMFFGLLLFGLYVLVIRPQRARARALAEVRAALAPGSRVITTAGIHATVRSIEDGVVLLEIAPGVLVRFADAAVIRLLEPSDEPSGRTGGRTGDQAPRKAGDRPAEPPAP